MTKENSPIKIQANVFLRTSTSVKESKFSDSDIEAFAVPLIQRTNDIQDQREIERNVAIIRAQTHIPQGDYNGLKIPTGEEYRKKRTKAIILLANKLSSGNPFMEGEFEKQVLNDDADSNITPTSEYMKEFKLGKPELNFTKTQLEIINIVTGAIAGATATVLAPEVIIMLSAASVVSGLKAAITPDVDTQNAINDAMIQVSQNLWNDPKAEQVIKSEVKEVFRDVFGIDFTASLEDHKSHLSPQLQKYVDIYIQNANEETKKTVEQIGKDIISEVKDSLETAVSEVIEHINNLRNAEIEFQRNKRYDDGELQGKIYLANILTGFVNPQAAEIVNTLGNAGLQLINILSAIGSGVMGPFGAIAGLTNVGMEIAKLFGGDQQNPNQVLLDSMGNIQKSIAKVQESIQALHQDMAKWFGQVFENQQKILKRIDDQFSLLRIENGKYHLQVIESLSKIYTQNIIQLDENRDEGRRQPEKIFKNSILALNLEVPKKDVYNKEIIKEAIKQIYLYGLESAFTRNFTGLPDGGKLLWDPNKISQIINSIDSVDHFVGIAPSLIDYFIPGKFNEFAPLYNPQSLGKASAALSYAYSLFPEVAIEFETGVSFLKDFKNVLTGTAKSLLEATDHEVIYAVKLKYLNLIDLILEEAIEYAYDKKIQNVQNDKIFASGPLNKIFLTNTTHYGRKTHFEDIVENSIRRDEVTIENDYYAVWQELQEPFINFGTFTLLEWQGIDQIDSNIKSTRALDLLELAKKFGIITMAEIVSKERITAWAKVLRSTGELHLEMSREQHHLQENSEVISLTFSPFGKTPLSIGSWVTSKLTDTGKDFDDNVRIKNKIEYLSIKDAPDKIFTDSVDLLTALTDELNNLYSLKNDLIKDFTTEMTGLYASHIEFEAVAKCLKYFAGLNAYVKTGNLQLGTKIVTEKTSVIYYLESKTELDDKMKNLIINPPFSSGDISDFINLVTNEEYLSDPENLKRRVNVDPEIREYIKSEVKFLIKKALANYIDAHFPLKLNEIILPELSVPSEMLATVEGSLI